MDQKVGIREGSVSSSGMTDRTMGEVSHCSCLCQMCVIKKGLLG